VQSPGTGSFKTARANSVFEAKDGLHSAQAIEPALGPVRGGRSASRVSVTWLVAGPTLEAIARQRSGVRSR
jgi:hypothetical protein